MQSIGTSAEHWNENASGRLPKKLIPGLDLEPVLFQVPPSQKAAFLGWTWYINHIAYGDLD